MAIALLIPVVLPVTMMPLPCNLIHSQFLVLGTWFFNITQVRAKILCLLLTAYCLLLTAYCLLPTVYCPLPTAYLTPASARSSQLPPSAFSRTLHAIA